ncbi:MAG: hypothetical protein M1435_02405 [Actinobacteria bacterium]|nr:hypothetical protein [Actinomycetota bacterium]
MKWTTGRVLLACDGADEPAVSATVGELGLDYELVRNRDALIVLDLPDGEGVSSLFRRAWFEVKGAPFPGSLPDRA